MKPSPFLFAALCLIVGAGLAYGYMKYLPPAPEATGTETPTKTASSPSPTATGSAGLQVEQPAASAVVASPLTVKGSATGGWFFEGTFRTRLVDADGNLVAQGVATATTDWMTDSPVPFTTTLSFTAPSSEGGALILEGDNPSGLPENARSYTVPVHFR